MDELFLEMHKEAMELQKAVTELRYMIDDLSDAIEEREVEVASRSWGSTREDVENAAIDVKKLKKILGMHPGICGKAEKILIEKELKNEE